MSLPLFHPLDETDLDLDLDVYSKCFTLTFSVYVSLFPFLFLTSSTLLFFKTTVIINNCIY